MGRLLLVTVAVFLMLLSIMTSAYASPPSECTTWEEVSSSIDYYPSAPNSVVCLRLTKDVEHIGIHGDPWVVAVDLNGHSVLNITFSSNMSVWIGNGQVHTIVNEREGMLPTTISLENVSIIESGALMAEIFEITNSHLNQTAICASTRVHMDEASTFTLEDPFTGEHLSLTRDQIYMPGNSVPSPRVAFTSFGDYTYEENWDENTTILLCPGSTVHFTSPVSTRKIVVLNIVQYSSRNYFIFEDNTSSVDLLLQELCYGEGGSGFYSSSMDFASPLYVSADTPHIIKIYNKQHAPFPIISGDIHEENQAKVYLYTERVECGADCNIDVTILANPGDTLRISPLSGQGITVYADGIDAQALLATDNFNLQNPVKIYNASDPFPYEMNVQTPLYLYDVHPQHTVNVTCSEDGEVYLEGTTDSSKFVFNNCVVHDETETSEEYPSDSCTSWTDVSGTVEITTSGCYRVTENYTYLKIRGGDTIVVDLNGHETHFDFCPSSDLNVQELEAFNGWFNNPCASYRMHIANVYLHDLERAFGYFISAGNVDIKNIAEGDLSITSDLYTDANISVVNVHNMRLILKPVKPADINIADSDFEKLYIYAYPDVNIQITDTNLTYKTVIVHGHALNLDLNNVLLDGRQLTYNNDTSTWESDGAYLTDSLPATAPVHVHYVGVLSEGFYNLNSDHTYADYLALYAASNITDFTGGIVQFVGSVDTITNSTVDLYAREYLTMYYSSELLNSTVSVFWRETTPDGGFRVYTQDFDMSGSTINTGGFEIQPQSTETNIHNGTLNIWHGFVFATSPDHIFNIYSTTINAKDVWLGKTWLYISAYASNLTINFIGATFSGDLYPLTIKIYAPDSDVHFRDVNFAGQTTIICDSENTTLYFEGTTNTDNVTVDQSCQLPVLPNLRVKKIEYTPEKVTTNTLVAVYATIENNYTSSITTKVKFYVDETLYSSQTVSLEPGDNNIMLHNGVSISTPGQHTFRVIVDPDNEVTESDETDNELNTTVNVLQYIELSSCIGEINVPAYVVQIADFENAPQYCVTINAPYVEWHSNGHNFTGYSSLVVEGDSNVTFYGDVNPAGDTASIMITFRGGQEVNINDYSELRIYTTSTSYATVRLTNVTKTDISTLSYQNIIVEDSTEFEYIGTIYGCGELVPNNSVITSVSYMIPSYADHTARAVPLYANVVATDENAAYIWRCTIPEFGIGTVQSVFITADQNIEISDVNVLGRFKIVTKNFDPTIHSTIRNVWTSHLEIESGTYTIENTRIGYMVEPILAERGLEFHIHNFRILHGTGSITDSEINVSYLQFGSGYPPADVTIENSKVYAYSATGLATVRMVNGTITFDLTEAPSEFIVEDNADCSFYGDNNIICLGDAYLYTTPYTKSSMPFDSSCLDNMVDLTGDYYVENVQTEPETVETGKPVTVSFSIVSTHAFAPTATVHYEIYVDGTKVAEDDVAVSAGSSTQVEANIVAPAIPGQHTVEVVISPPSDMPDTNSSNNTAQISVLAEQPVPQESAPASVGAGVTEYISTTRAIYVSGRINEQKNVMIPVFWEMPFKVKARLTYKGSVKGPETVMLSPGKNTIPVKVLITGSGKIGEVIISAGQYKTTANIYSTVLAQGVLPVSVNGNRVLLFAIILLAAYLLFGR